MVKYTCYPYFLTNPWIILIWTYSAKRMVKCNVFFFWVQLWSWLETLVPLFDGIQMKYYYWASGYYTKFPVGGKIFGDNRPKFINGQFLPNNILSLLSVMFIQIKNINFNQFLKLKFGFCLLNLSRWSEKSWLIIR